MRDATDSPGFSPTLWKQMAELGWVGILIPEAYGDSGLGLADLVVILKALGCSLVPAPFLSTVLLGGQLQIQAGSADA